MKRISIEEMIEFCIKAAKCIGEYESRDELTSLSYDELQEKFEWYDYLLDK